MLKQIVNKFISFTEVKTIKDDSKTVFLTFDDGPQPGITEFVLEELGKYGFKATFFCRGDNAKSNPDLLKALRDKGHSIGNHTYNHIHSYETISKDYVEDVELANSVLNTTLFRPPHGSLTLSAWLKLHKKYRIVFWALNSEDSNLANFDLQHAITNLKQNTKSGDVVLFHFCHRHEKETRQILPMYLKWIHDQGYDSKAINEKTIKLIIK